jgi:uncharacterized circularly permuted ATP-grasp superfamily protein
MLDTGVNSKPNLLEYLPVIIAALDGEQTGLAGITIHKCNTISC